MPETFQSVRRRRPKATPRAGNQLPVENTQYLSKGINRALDVIDSFGDANCELSLMDISQRTSLPESSLFRILLTLRNRAYLVQGQDGSYRLSPKLLSGRFQERANAMRKFLQPRLQSIARQFDETASSAFLFEDRIQVLDTVESLRDIRATTRIGRVLPPYASSMGKAITAFQNSERADHLIEVYGLFKRTKFTVIDRHAIYREYEQIRTAGIAFDRGEATEGGVCIGIPIFSQPGKVEAAISVSIPLVRHTKQLEKEVVTAMRKATSNLCEDISRL